MKSFFSLHEHQQENSTTDPYHRISKQLIHCVSSGSSHATENRPDPASEGSDHLRLILNCVTAHEHLSPWNDSGRHIDSLLDVVQYLVKINHLLTTHEKKVQNCFQLKGGMTVGEVRAKKSNA